MCEVRRVGFAAEAGKRLEKKLMKIAAGRRIKAVCESKSGEKCFLARLREKEDSRQTKRVGGEDSG